jgi:Arc/MetJ family transcription regulator
MKRTNIVVDEHLLDEACRIAGTKTYSEAVTLGLQELIRRKTFDRIDEYASSGIWEGELEAMRVDHVPD